MKLRLKNNKILKDCFNSISNIIDKVVMEADSEGLTLKSLSRDHITFVELMLKSSLFDDYHCPVPESFCVNVDILDSILKRCKNNETLELELDDDLMVRIISTRNREFNVESLPFEEEIFQKSPSNNFALEVTVPTNVLKDSIKDVDIIKKDDNSSPSKILFCVENGSLVLKSQADFIRITTEIHNECGYDEISSLFNLEYIKNVFKSSNIAEDCILRLGNNEPLEIIFNIDNGSFIRYIIAPLLFEESNVFGKEFFYI